VPKGARVLSFVNTASYEKERAAKQKRLLLKRQEAADRASAKAIQDQQSLDAEALAATMTMTMRAEDFEEKAADSDGEWNAPIRPDKVITVEYGDLPVFFPEFMDDPLKRALTSPSPQKQAFWGGESGGLAVSPFPTAQTGTRKWYSKEGKLLDGKNEARGRVQKRLTRRRRNPLHAQQRDSSRNAVLGPPPPRPAPPEDETPRRADNSRVSIPRASVAEAH